MDLILDTNFIITLERESRRDSSKRADQFLASHPDDVLFITFTVAGELACGRSVSMRNDWERLCRPYPILAWNKEVSWQYGEIYRALAESGQLIGTNDMWIAATALAHGMGVVTNNEAEFSRVTGLSVFTY